MRSHLSSASTLVTSTQIRSQHFLVPPFSRLPFTVLFVLATGLGWLLVALILRQFQILTLPVMLQDGTLPGTFVYGLVTGLIVGALQWLVLRRYIPDWLWILATTTGYVILITTLQGWRNLIDQILLNSPIAARFETLPPLLLVAIASLLGTLLATLCAIWLGLAQWLVLRQYARPSWGWVFVPAGAVLVSSILAGLNTPLSLAKMPLFLDVGVLSAGILGTAQGIALCALQKKTTGSAISINRMLATAPEIFDYLQIRHLAQQLRLQINQAWLSEISTDRPLRYLVGLDSAGAIAAYEPINQSALDRANQTPLPGLVNPAISESSAEITPPPLAHFQVSFLPSGSLEILPWRGIPLLWIGLGMGAVVVVVSAIVSYFGRILPGL